jgi:AcrR family transcriptional regulator
MPSLRNTAPDRQSVAPDDVLLDAARDCLLAVGWRRTTLTEVARRAGVSRMTMYRRWPDMQTLMADLMTREWSTIGTNAQLLVEGQSPTAADVAGAVVGAANALRDNPLFRKIVGVDPELLLTYLIDRRGRTQDALLQVLEARIREGQVAGSMRAGDPAAMARSVVLSVHGFVISAATMADVVSVDVLADELRLMLERYLRP